MSKLKKVKIGVIVMIISVLGYIGFKLLFGHINFRATFNTEYTYTEDEDIQIVKTNWSMLQTPRGWTHITYNNTCPGFVGSFRTKYGELHYECGMFSPVPESYYEQNFITENTIEIDSIGEYAIIFESRENELLIYIPEQHDLHTHFSFYPSSNCADAKNDILKYFRIMSVRKPYSPYPTLYPQ